MSNLPPPRKFESTLAFDALDLDLVVKVASHTIFSPFFTFFVPIIYKGVGQAWTEPTVYLSVAWFLLVTSICEHYSRRLLNHIKPCLSIAYRVSGIRCKQVA